MASISSDSTAEASYVSVGRPVSEVVLASGTSSVGSSGATASGNDDGRVKLHHWFFDERGQVVECDDTVALFKSSFGDEADCFVKRKELEQARELLKDTAKATYMKEVFKRATSKEWIRPDKQHGQDMKDLYKCIREKAAGLKVECSGDLSESARTLSSEVIEAVEKIYDIFYAFTHTNATGFVNRVLDEFERNSNYSVARPNGSLGGLARIILDVKKEITKTFFRVVQPVVGWKVVVKNTNTNPIAEGSGKRVERKIANIEYVDLDGKGHKDGSCYVVLEIPSVRGGVWGWAAITYTNLCGTDGETETGGPGTCRAASNELNYISMSLV